MSTYPGKTCFGRLWERILLLINAPFLALSATVGAPEKFVGWLQSIKDLQKEQDPSGARESYKVRLVEHGQRWVDLRRHVAVDAPPAKGSGGVPTGLDAVVRWARLHQRPRVDHTSGVAQDGAELLHSLHPLASFTEANLSG
ncbi:hypothetical protein T484DRAFT_1763201 [Baffinella frigidus]|nr:hypothetical protein T484DRAFT_1763201 [Cryptophyta sp. CCMP2293]